MKNIKSQFDFAVLLLEAHLNHSMYNLAFRTKYLLHLTKIKIQNSLQFFEIIISSEWFNTCELSYKVNSEIQLL